MLRLALGLFLVLHGFVHLLYAGQSRALFELQPGLTWPIGSWGLSSLLSPDAVRWIGVLSMAVAAAGFLLGGAALLLSQSWWRPAVIAAAAFSSLVFFVLWDGGLQRLDQQGAVGVAINVAILAVALIWGGTLVGVSPGQASSN